MLTPITVTGHLLNPDGSAASGGFTFQLSDAEGNPTGITDRSTDEIVPPVPIAATVNSGVLLSNDASSSPVVLLANDDPTTTPTGTVYWVTENLAAGSLDPWPLTVHHDAVGGTVDISSQRPTP